jgi:hypothetical protein
MHEVAEEAGQILCPACRAWAAAHVECGLMRAEAWIGELEEEPS